MRAIILAAGTGSRLSAHGGRGAATPKPAVVVAGHPLLETAIRFARAAGADKVAAILGHEREITEPLARKCGVDDVAWNPRFRDAGNLESLEVARQAGLCDGAVLLMNADHIYRPTIAEIVARVAASATQVTAFIDTDRQLGADDMKVRLDEDRRVVAISKQLDGWDAGYVGMTFVPANAVSNYFYTADNARNEKGDSIHVEAVLQRMVGVEAAATADISGHGWFEVDDEADWQRAESALGRDPWY